MPLSLAVETRRKEGVGVGLPLRFSFKQALGLWSLAAFFRFLRDGVQREPHVDRRRALQRWLRGVLRRDLGEAPKGCATPRHLHASTLCSSASHLPHQCGEESACFPSRGGAASPGRLRGGSADIKHLPRVEDVPGTLCCQIRS